MRLAAALGWLRDSSSPSSPSVRAVGFSLLAAGALSGLVGVAAVLFAQGIDEFDMRRYAYREVAGASLAMALALFLGGATVSLPLHRAAKWSALAGGLFCLGGVAAFVSLYPYLWNVPGQDLSPWAVVPYGIGLAWLVASLTSGLVAAYAEILRARREEGVEDDVSEEEIMRDLEWASKKRLTWGGVHTDDRELELSPTALPKGVIRGKIGIRYTLEDEGLTGDIGSLLAFRGVKGAASEDYDDSPVSVLARLREEKAAKPPTLLERLLGWWRRITA